LGNLKFYPPHEIKVTCKQLSKNYHSSLFLSF